jgi:hypothetical protein
MNKYRKKRLIAMQVYVIVLATLFVAVSVNAQTTATGTISNQAGGPPLFKVTHDATLQGDGTSASPLGISASPTVSGALTVTGDIQARNIVSANSTVNGALAVTGKIQANATIVDDEVTAQGIMAHTIGVRAQDTKIKSAISAFGSLGVGGGVGISGIGSSSIVRNGILMGGTGLEGDGGASEFGDGGVGVLGQGGEGTLHDATGGIGVQGEGGSPNARTGRAGVGVMGIGGSTIFGNGGAGVVAIGGSGDGNDKSGGTGLIASGGGGDLGAANGLAAEFDGDVRISGLLVKGSGSFKIDHPLDPENKYLSHSFVESPDMMNIYNGNVTTDSNGDALVQLPEYFAALNRDFRYQLTVIGTFADSTIAEELNDNHFRIRTSLPNVEVSWQVTGIRQDAYANRNRIAVEQDKPEAKRGFYLHPEAFGQPLEKSILTGLQQK